MALDTMQYGYLVDPMFSFTDENGNPIRGGYIVVCLPGTNTKVITNANWDGSLNPERIPLDASGRLQNFCIVQKASAYKVLICDEGNDESVPIKTIDRMFAQGADIHYDGATTVIEGLNSAKNTDGKLDVTVANKEITINATGKLATSEALLHLENTTEAALNAIDGRIEILNGDIVDCTYSINAVNGRVDDLNGKVEDRTDVYKIFKDGEFNFGELYESIDEKKSFYSKIVNPVTRKIVYLKLASKHSDKIVFDGVYDGVLYTQTFLPNGTFSTTTYDIEGIDRDLDERLESEAQVRSNTDRALGFAIDNTKAELEQSIATKANADEVSQALSTKANADEVNAVLATKANASEVYTKGAVDAALDAKADKATTYTKTEVDNKVDTKVDEAPADGKQYARKDGSWAKIDADVTKEYVDTELGKKVDKVEGKDVQALEAGYVKGDFTKAATCASIDQAIAQATLNPSSFVVDNTFNPASSNAQSGKALAFLFHEDQLDGNFIGPSKEYNKITTRTQAYWPIFETTLGPYGSFELELELIQPGYKSLKGKENAYLLFSFGLSRNVEGARVQRQQFIRIGNVRGYSNQMFYYNANQSTGRVVVYAKLTETTNSFVLIRLLRSSRYATICRFYKDLLSVEDDELEKVPFTQAEPYYFNSQRGSASSPIFINSNGAIESCNGIIVPEPPSTGNVVLKSVNGVLSWVAEPSTQSDE